MYTNDIWNFMLRRGNGHNPSEGACLMDAVSWFEYGTLGDHPECVCPVIAAYCRNVNDAMTDAGRQKLKVFIPRLIGTRDEASERERAEYLVWQAIKVFTPFWLDKAGMAASAALLRGYEGSIEGARVHLEAIKKRAAYTSSSAYYAAYASSASAYDAEWEPLGLAALDGVLRIGKQAEPLEPARVIAANKTFAKARQFTNS